MSLQSYYATLGLQEGVEASDVKRAYRVLALKWHPDKHPPEHRDAAEQCFKVIGEAYDVLYDLLSRLPNRIPCGLAQSAKSKRPSSNEHDAQGAPADTCFCREAFVAPTCVQAAMLRALLPAFRIEFARGSASVRRAYKGLELEELASSRQRSIAAAGCWATDWGAAAHLEVRGCFIVGEVRPQASNELALARANGALRYLVAECGLDAAKCRVCNSVGDTHQGVEIRPRVRLDIDGAFDDMTPDATRLHDAPFVLDIAAEQAKACRGRRLQVEVATGEGGLALAKRRCAGVQRELAARGLVGSSMLDVRCVPGEKARATFFVHLSSSPHLLTTGATPRSGWS